MINSLTIFLPAYNDQGTIARLVSDAILTLDPLRIDYEIIVIDDASKDATAKIVKDICETNNHVRLVQHDQNRDYGGALKSGFANAAKEWVFYTDGDGQYDIKEITRLLPCAEEYDLINGYILKRNDPLYRIALGKMYQFLIDLCFGRTLKYINCDFRLIRKEAMDRIKINSNSGFAPAEIVIKLIRNGARVNEVLIGHFPRRYGRSQFFKAKKLRNIFTDFTRFLRKR